MTKLVAVFVLSTLALGNWTGSIRAQAPGVGELHGTVSDESGAVIVGAPLVLDDGNGHKYSAKTNDRGEYRITGIIPGLYTLTTDYEGFSPFSQKVDLTAKPALTLNLTLKVT